MNIIVFNIMSFLMIPVFLVFGLFCFGGDGEVDNRFLAYLQFILGVFLYILVLYLLKKKK